MGRETESEMTIPDGGSPMHEAGMTAEKPWWEKPHTFQAKVFQGREQLACEICGRLENALVHTDAASRLEERQP